MSTIVQLLNEVMKDVGAISKTDKNTSQGFNFRGIDSVINAVSPALRKHGIVVVPCVDDYQYESVEIGKNRTVMGHVKVRVTYTFAGPDGDALKASVVGEAMDSGDKATAKAMSVAFRTALLQSLCLPTDDIDPDAQSYERSERVVVDTKALATAIAQAADIETLAKIGQYITTNKEHIEPTILETLRISFKEAQSKVAVAVVETSTKEAADEPVNA
jgi:ERF superfamily